MVKFETMEFKVVPFGKSNFVEIARKKTVKESGEDTEFISVSRGYFTKEDEKRYRKSVTLPLDDDVRKDIARHILEI